MHSFYFVKDGDKVSLYYINKETSETRVLTSDDLLLSIDPTSDSAASDVEDLVYSYDSVSAWDKAYYRTVMPYIEDCMNKKGAYVIKVDRTSFDPYDELFTLKGANS